MADSTDTTSFIKTLKDTVDYDPETGIFKWKPRPFSPPNINGLLARRNAGALSHGYLRLTIGNRGYYAHRLAWIYVYGKWPVGEIDHIDLNKSNNKIANLRQSDSSQNSCNMAIPSTNTSGYKCVSWNKKTGRWMAKIQIRKKQIYLGLFDTPEAAYQAYCEMVPNLHGEFARMK
jgi:hypothetical protein